MERFYQKKLISQISIFLPSIKVILIPFILIILIISFLSLFLSCGGEQKEAPSIPTQEKSLLTPDNIEETFPWNKPVRIVSLAPNITEILYSLGAEDCIVGVTSFCNYPSQALSKTKIGGFTKPNLEVIISLKPDLVICTPNVGNKDAVLNLIKHIDAKVLLVKAESLEDLYKTIEGIGKAIHEKEKALSLVRSIKMEMERFKSKAASLKRKKVLLSLSIEPVIAASANSYPGTLASIAGGDIIPSFKKGVHSFNSYRPVSFEEIISLNPEIIIQTMMDPINQGEKELFKRYWEQWNTISAVQNGEIYLISGDIILRPSPRAAEGVELLFNLIYDKSEEISLSEKAFLSKKMSLSENTYLLEKISLSERIALSEKASL